MAARLTLGMLLWMLMLAKIQFGTRDVCQSEVGWGDYRVPIEEELGCEVAGEGGRGWGRA